MAKGKRAATPPADRVLKESETIPEPPSVVQPAEGPVAMIADNPVSVAPQSSPDSTPDSGPTDT